MEQSFENEVRPTLEWSLFFYIFLVFGAVGWIYNLGHLIEEQSFFGYFVDTFLLSYTNLLAYPFLFYVFFADKKRNYFWWNTKAREWLYIFLISPVGIVIISWLVKFISLVWKA